MKRSEGNVIQLNGHGWDMSKDGIKTITSRLGDRTEQYVTGGIYTLKNNETGAELLVKLTNQVVKPLKEVTPEEALAIGNYTVAEHALELYQIYCEKLGNEVTGDTELTLQHYEVIQEVQEA